MTRSEFLDDVTDWWDLTGVMSDSEYDYHEDTYIHDDERYDEEVGYDIERAGDITWYDLRSRLDDLPESYSGHFYRCDGSFDYADVTDDFDYYKEAVLAWLDDAGWFEEEDEEEEEDTDASRDAFYVALDVPEEEEEDMELADELAPLDIAC